MEFVQEMFPKHVILLCGELPWPACLPDLSTHGYFLWGYLKAKVHITRPHAINDLKITIRKQISVISENMTRQTLGNVQARLEKCVCSDGQHLSDVLFKTK
jgi:hypothetical protein